MHDLTDPSNPPAPPGGYVRGHARSDRVPVNPLAEYPGTPRYLTRGAVGAHIDLI